MEGLARDYGLNGLPNATMITIDFVRQRGERKERNGPKPAEEIHFLLNAGRRTNLADESYQ